MKAKFTSELKIGDIWQAHNGNHYLKITQNESIPIPDLSNLENIPKCWLDEASKTIRLVTKVMKVGKIKYKKPS